MLVAVVVIVAIAIVIVPIAIVGIIVVASPAVTWVIVAAALPRLTRWRTVSAAIIWQIVDWRVSKCDGR